MAITRRSFIQKAVGIGAVTAIHALPHDLWAATPYAPLDFNISLAQWSLHKSFFSKEISPVDFPMVARNTYGIDTIEYVNQFFPDKAKDQIFLKTLKQRCDDHGVTSHLIMIDNEGPLGDRGKITREKAIVNHYKWVDAASFLGCLSIRVNLHGEGTLEEWKKASVESLLKLSEYAGKQNLNVIVENHGGFSSNGGDVAEIIRNTKNKRCGTLPDFANFCVRREKGDLYESPCVDWYDRYKGVKEMLPYAKGVSAKTFDFDKDGNDTSTDFRRMFTIIKQSGFKGYVGIEYEGEKISEEEGIKKTKALLEKIKKELQ